MCACQPKNGVRRAQNEQGQRGMGRATDELERAYDAWAQSLERSKATVERTLHERQCRHCEAGDAGTWHTGGEYLQALQRLRGGEALRLAGQVRAFFWSDAPLIRVRLCRTCAAGLRL